jgi:hypothetical protein
MSKLSELREFEMVPSSGLSHGEMLAITGLSSEAYFKWIKHALMPELVPLNTGRAGAQENAAN